MSRLVVVLPVSPLRDGESFAVKDWPLHITVLPPFLTEAPPGEMADAITAAAFEQTPITAMAGEDAMFGRREDVPVTLVDDNEALTRLHRALIEAVRPFATSPDEPAFTGPGFRPHVTIKNGNRVYEGDVVTLTQIALVDMAPRAPSSGPTVLATIDLSAAVPR